MHDSVAPMHMARCGRAIHHAAMTDAIAICRMLFFYCLGLSFMLQVVVYPTYQQVGVAEFVPFHQAQARRMIPVLMMPMFATSIFAMVLAVLGCAAVIVLTTLIRELPRHLLLDKKGKDERVVRELVRENLPRTLAWVIGCVLLARL
jgi:hypothetical protein